MTTEEDRRRAMLDRRARRDREITRLKAYGRWVDPYVTPDEARAHIAATCERYGISFESFGRLVGMHGEQIRSIMTPGHGKYPHKIRRITAGRILRARFDLDLLADDAWVDSTGTRRRMRALGRIGWSFTVQGERLGTDRKGAYNFAASKRVSARIARKVRDLYDELWDQPGPSWRTQQRAAEKHWPGPLAWDDDTIDDPAVVPVDVTPSNAQRTSADVAESLADLLDIEPGITAEHAAHRLGYGDAQGLYLAIKRAERPELRARLDRNNEAANPAPLVTKADAYGRRKKEQAA